MEPSKNLRMSLNLKMILKILTTVHYGLVEDFWGCFYNQIVFHVSATKIRAKFNFKSLVISRKSENNA